MPTISTLVVDVVTKTSNFSKGMATIAGGLAIIGVASTKMALDYEDSFTKISSLSNASAKDVEKWKGQVLDLAGKTAQAPKELADALYFLASAGLKTNQIMPVLEASAKASAIGLGDTADVAKLTANALNAYAGTGLKASKATDILVSAIKEGSADTDEFGTAIGRILPIASKAGVGFDAVAASLASLSNIGLDVNEGVTAMRGLLQALVSPTNSAADALANVGLSADDLLQSLSEQGLIGTIRFLDQTIKDNTSTQGEYLGTLREIVPNVRALTGVLGLTEQQASKVDTIFKNVAGSTGSLDEAFKTTAAGPAFKFQQALAELKVAAIKLGQAILPIALDIVHALQGMVEWFSQLPKGIQGAIVKFGLLALTIGPLIKLFSPLVGGIRAATVALGGTEVAAGAAATAFAPILATAATAAGVAIAGAGLIAAATRGQTEKMAHSLDQASISTEQLGNVADGTAYASARLGTGVQDAAKAAIELRNADKLAAASVSGLAEVQKELWFAMSQANQITEAQRERLREVIVQIVSMGGKLSDLEQKQIRNLLAQGDFNDALKIAEDRLRTTTKGVEDLDKAIGGLPAKKAIDIIADTREARAAVAGFRDWIMGMGPVSINVAAHLYKTDFGVVPRGQHGGLIGQSGSILVGEAGPEVVTLPRGARIHPSGEGGAGGNVYINVTGWVGDEQRLADRIHTVLLAKQRRNVTLGLQ